ncbi:MAG: esterase-like activity of phytase family protein [Myxococcota bacterium]
MCGVDSLRATWPVIILLVVGCAQPSTGDPPPSKPAPPEVAPSSRYIVGARRSLDVGKLSGFSSLARKPNGELWSAPERGNVLVRLRIDGPDPGKVGSPVPLRGVPKAWDVESMTWLDDERFAVGTETQREGRPSDEIKFGRIEDGTARVRTAVVLPYRLWNIRARANKGIEGLCSAGRFLIAGVETVEGRDGVRFGPLGRYDMERRQWVPFRVRLTSATGKLSAVACKLAAGGASLDVFAIERHFEMSHLLRFTVPTDGSGGEIVPRVVADLGHMLPDSPNMEGLAFRPAGGLLIIVDNNYGGIRGPTEVVLLELDEVKR